MPWKETRAVDERMRFVLAAEAGEEADGGGVPAVRDQPADTAYKWLDALARRGRGGARRPVAGAAPPSAGGGGGARRGLSRRCAGRIRPGGR